jgi:hypothetical protein
VAGVLVAAGGVAAWAALRNAPRQPGVPEVAPEFAIVA